ncbi:protein FAM114A2-like [Ostrinia nubilalis]|uniref:protein FAM114A2-like n=1 Tax=Ostrinia nubilalis TaxID=29057 RepID=UPI0030823CA7
MPSSDSEDFESADEGQTHMERKERKKRLSSSNYSDNALESDLGPKETSSKGGIVEKPKEETKDGWDDFDIDNNELDDNVSKTAVSKKENEPKAKESTKSQDTGWDDFGDWGQDDFTSNEHKKTEPTKPVQQEPDAKIKEVTERLASASTKSNSWGWGWGVDSLLSTATAGITTLTNQVSQGITTVLETGIGAPDPEELARKNMREAEAANKTDQTTPGEVQEKAETPASSEAAFPFGSLFSGVTKFVETTGTKVIAGGLDTLETIGKKTMEVLQDGDPGLAKKRAMLGLDSGDKPVLSQILREAKAKAEEEDKVREEKREAKEVHYERLFDDFEGLVHLEALEMLSRQVSLRIDERMRGLDPAKRQDIKETMQQVAELCEMPEEDDDDEEPVSEDMSKPDAFHERLQTATQDLGLKLQFQPLVK